jgi:hypothetical protein
MRAFLAVFEREVYERRLLGVVALVLGLAAVAAPAVPGLRPGGVSSEDLRNGMALGFALLLTVLMALFLGVSVIGSDLAERRLGFYFARPLSGRVIWGGKIAAALALIFGAGLLVVAPAAVLGGGFNPNGLWIEGVWSLSGSVFLELAAAGLLFLFLAAHAASVIVRARSAWVLLDVVALGLVSLLIEWPLRRLAFEGVLPTRIFWMRGVGVVTSETGVSAWIVLALVVAGFIALLLAGALQVTRGRTDPRRGHRFLSATLWGILLAAALLGAGFTSWVLAAGPGDLSRVERFVAAPKGTWMAFTGAAERRPGYYPSFLYNLDSGRFVRARFGLIYNFYNGIEPFVRFSADGRRAVWLEYDGAPPATLLLYRMDLDRPGAEPVRSTISFKSPPGNLALSPDGRLLAIYDWDSRDYGGRLTVQETDSGRLISSVRYESAGPRPRLVFVPSGRLRVYETALYGRPGFPDEVKESPLGISELDFATSHPRLETIGRMPLTHGLASWSLDPAGDRVFLRGKEGLRLCDARTGALLAQVGEVRSFGYFLTDGRVAVLDRPLVAPWTLRVLSADGRSELRRFGFEGSRRVVVADQTSPGLLRVLVSSSGSNPSPWDLRVLDLESGASRSLGARRLSSPEGGRHTQASIPLGRVDGVIWFDPMSFQERVVLKDS